MKAVIERETGSIFAGKAANQRNDEFIQKNMSSLKAAFIGEGERKSFV